MKFTLAWASLCGVTSDSTTGALAPKILAAAAAAKSDPFMLAALARYGSHCDAAYKAKKGGAYGLLAIEPSMYRAAGAPELPVDKTDLTPKRLLEADVNLAVGAALLEMWNTAHKSSTRRSAAACTAAASRTSSGATTCARAARRISS